MSRNADADFRAWATANREGLRRTAFLLSGDWFLADDLVQDTLIRMVRAWPRLTGTGNADAYSRRVLLNLYLDHLRRPSRRERPASALPDHPAPDLDATGYREQLIAALREVPPGQRAVLVLRFWEDLSINQTAEALGTSAGNVKSQTSRGLATLREALAARGLPDSFSLQEQP